MAIKFANNATTTLAGSLTAGATSMTVATGDGAKFPTLSGSDYFLTTLIKQVAGLPVYEIVKVTARSGDVFTIVRGQEGTTATTFSVADRAELRLTRDTFTEFPQKSENATFTGNNTFNGTSTFGGNSTHTGDITMSGASFIEAEGAAVASASSTNIWATDGNTRHITVSAGTINDFGTAPQAGAWMKVIFDGTLTLTHSANLNLNNGGSNVTVAAGDMAMVYADTTTQMDVFIMRANGLPVATIPQSALVLLATLTPSVAANLDALNAFTASYDNYLIILDGIAPNAGTDTLAYRLANGGVVDTAANYLSTAFNGGNSTASSQTLASNVASGTDTVNGRIELLNVAAATKKGGHAIAAATTNPSTQGVAVHLVYSGGAVSGIRFFWTGGASFAATGKIRIYGYSNT